jgi:triosephosphate isomerase
MTERGKPLFAANWKMFKGPREAEVFAASFASLYPAHPDRRVAFFPPAISIEAFIQATEHRPDLEAGVQDVHEEVDGAHTGGISAGMAAQAGSTWALAGHSERRREFGDDDALVRAKVGRILDAGLKPIVCIGETLEEREAGMLSEVLERQIRAVLASVHGEPLTWAYEPVWAIGTGRTASPEDAGEAHEIAREAIRGGGAGEFADSAVILYGGSVKPGNIEQLMAVAGVDGVLVGGASLDPEAFASICACPIGVR